MEKEGLLRDIGEIFTYAERGRNSYNPEYKRGTFNWIERGCYNIIYKYPCYGCTSIEGRRFLMKLKGEDTSIIDWAIHVLFCVVMGRKAYTYAEFNIYLEDIMMTQEEIYSKLGLPKIRRKEEFKQ